MELIKESEIIMKNKHLPVIGVGPTSRWGQTREEEGSIEKNTGGGV